MGMITKLKCAKELCSHICNSQAGHSHPESWVLVVCFLGKRNEIIHLNIQLTRSVSKPINWEGQKEGGGAGIPFIML